jgi:hypothetical protein
LGEAALFFDGLNAEQAAARILELADTGLRQRLVQAGRALAALRTPDDYVRQINASLDEFAKKRRLWSGGNSYRHL